MGGLSHLGSTLEASMGYSLSPRSYSLWNSVKSKERGNKGICLEEVYNRVGIMREERDVN